MTPEFWHRFLAAELSPTKCRDVLRGLGTSALDPLEELLRSPLLTEGERNRIQQADLEALSALTKSGMEVIEPSRYPEPLRQTPLVPPALFAWGDWSILSRPCIGIVGTRNATTYGKACALKFAEALAENGVTVISGGALGIDGCAHKGALNVGGMTAAVLITGLDKSYPREHSGLFQRIRENKGCLITQFPAGTKSAWDTRPLVRNQTVAALCHALVVIEAPSQSGALHTAHAANEIGRPVFVVPANVDNLNFRGSHGLIRDGATLVDHPYQVLTAMGIEPQSAEKPTAQTNEVQRRILEALRDQPLSAELIVDKTGLQTADVMSELTMLELEGLILRDAGGFAIRP